MEEFLKSFKNHILMHKILPPKNGEYSNFNFKNRQVNDFLEHLSIKLYTHQIYNREPQIIALSATLKNPIEFAQKIFNRSFELIDKPTNPTSKRHIVVLESKQLDEKQLLAQLILELVLNRIKSLIFFDNRNKTEELLRFVLPHNVWNKVTTYKGTVCHEN